MKLTRKMLLVTLVMAAAVGASAGLVYAALDRKFDLPVKATVTVKMATAAETADVNGDGIVDSADLMIVVRNLNTRPASDDRADVDGNGVVDIGDLAFVARHFMAVIEQAPRLHIVQATDQETFVPPDISIKVGDEVRWDNVGLIIHTVTFAEPDLPSENFLEGDESFSVTFSRVGLFTYVCDFHPPHMVGSVTVTE